MSAPKPHSRKPAAAKSARVSSITDKAKELIKGLSKDILNHPMVASTGLNSRDTSPLQSQITVLDLIKDFAEPDTKRGSLTLAEYLALDKKKPEEKQVRQREKDGDYIILASFLRPGTRLSRDIEKMYGFMIDLDQGNYTKEQIEQKMAGTFCVAFSTYSHHCGDQHWRILVPYTEPILPTAHHKTFVHFNELFEGNLDPRCDNTAQIWYTPACPHDATPHYEVFVVSGELLNPDTVPEPIKAVAPSAHLPARPNCMSKEVERVRSALTVIPSDDYVLWVDLGMALKQQLPEEVSYNLWVEWSQKSVKFDPDDAERTWNSFRDDFDGVPVTLGTVFFRAKENGWVDTFTPMAPEVEDLNRTHFVAYQGGTCLVFAEKFDHELDRFVLQSYRFKDFREHNVNRRIKVLEGDKMKSSGVADLWLQHPARRTYDKIVFMPGLNTPPDVYNSWRGFAVAPAPGNWDLLKQHMLDNLCQGDVACYDYLLQWMAFAVQFPHKRPGVAVVMQGSVGTGKGKLASTFMKLFGAHALQITQSSHLTGKFNQHLRDCVLLYVDEALWAGDKAGENVLKGLITEDNLQVEKKFADVVNAPNRLHIMMASNNDWVVPAGPHERRYFVLQVGDGQMQNHTYFKAIDEQMLNAGGLEAMMHELLELDLSCFNVRDYPKTAALDQQKLQSLSADHLWWLDHLGQGNPTIWKYQSRAELAESFAKHGGTFRERSSDTRLGMFLKRVVPGLKKVMAQTRGVGNAVPCYEFPDLSTCRTAFIAHHGFVTNPWA